MLGIEPGTYIVSAQKREGFTEEEVLSESSSNRSKLYEVKEESI